MPRIETHKLVMAGVCVFCVVTVIGVHLQQTAERVEMHKGVLNDIERTRLKKVAVKEAKAAAKEAAAKAALTP